MHTVAVCHCDCCNIQLIWCRIFRGRGESLSMTNGQSFILNLFCRNLLSLIMFEQWFKYVKVSLLPNLHLLWEQLIRPCFFHPYPHCYPFHQFDFITSSWKNSFQPTSSCLLSMHPSLKTILLKCAFCHQKKIKIVFCHKRGLLCASAELVLHPASGLH